MNLSVYFLEEDALKKYDGVELRLHAFLTATLDRGECSVSHLTDTSTSAVKYPTLNFRGDFMGPGDVPAGREKGRRSFSHLELISDFSDL